MSATQIELRKSYLREARDCRSVGDEAQDYVAPSLVAQAVMRFSKSAITRLVVLDAGCGTGLVGQALATARGASSSSSSVSSIAAIDGIDFSPAMLAMARKTGVYRNLIRGDLTTRIHVVADAVYDVVVCLGTFTLGHVGSHPALMEFVRVTRPGGIVAATVLEEFWIPGGFQEEVEALIAEGQVAVVFRELIDYVKGHGDKAMLVILKKTACD